MEGVAIWYVLDMAVSLSAGVWINAVMNTVFFVALLAPPLIALRPRGGTGPATTAGAGSR